MPTNILGSEILGNIEPVSPAEFKPLWGLYFKKCAHLDRGEQFGVELRSVLLICAIRNGGRFLCLLITRQTFLIS
jgi:hypothetical protein